MKRYIILLKLYTLKWLKNSKVFQIYKNVGSERLIFVLDFEQIWQHIFYQVIVNKFLIPNND